MNKRDKILKLINTIKSAKKEKDKLIKELRKECNHDIVLECEYKPLNYFGSLAPIRICIFCTLEEEGWGCGYNKLASPEEIRKVSRDTVYRHRELKPLKTTTYIST